MQVHEKSSSNAKYLFHLLGFQFLIAFRNALLTSGIANELLITQPTTLRLNKSSSTAKQAQHAAVDK